MGLTAIFIVGFCVLGIYKIFELFVKKNERIALIEKLAISKESKEIDIPTLNFNKGSSPLRLSLLFMGVGIGCILAFFAQYYYFDSFLNVDFNDWGTRNNVNQIKFVLNFSFIAIFGGLGLFIAYLIESKKLKNKD